MLQVNLLPYLKMGKQNTKGKAPLVVRFTYQKHRKELSTGFSLTTEEWEVARSTKRTKNEFILQVRTFIETVQLRAMKIAATLQLEDRMDLDTLFELLLNRKPKSITLLQLHKTYLEHLHKRIGHDYTKASYAKFLQLGEKLKRFILKQFKTPDISTDKMNLSFIQLFHDYLTIDKRIGQNAAAKYCRNLKQLMSFGIDRGYSTSNPFANYRTRNKDVERVYLSPSELAKIENKPITNLRMALTRDLFVFQCYTGLSFVDMEALTPDHITEGADGNKWISIKRQKTGVRSTIPLLPKSICLLANYLGVKEGKLLPVISNQKYNNYLKELADICGIEKRLTSHCGRRTFATTVALSNGVSMESISRILGHKSTKITSMYAVVTDQRLSEEMERLNEKLQNNNSGKQTP